MYHVIQQERAKGNRTRTVGEQLFVNGVLHRPGVQHGGIHNQGSQEEQLSVLSWNINGLVRKRCGSDFEEYITQFDLVILFETWLPK